MVGVQDRLTLQITQNTVLKGRVAPSAQLAFHERVETSPLVLALKSFINSDAQEDLQGHLKIELSEPCHGSTVWYIEAQCCTVKEAAGEGQRHDDPTASSGSNAATPSPDGPYTQPRINAKGLDLLKQFEGFRSEAYVCPAGKWTIGYGFTKGVKAGDRITPEQAEARLQAELETYEQAVSKLATVVLSSNQFSALVCFAYNVGVNALRSSTLLKLLNRGDYQGAADQLLRWNKAGTKVLPGLARRRTAERSLFLL